LLVSAALVAVTVTVCVEAMDAGAVYKPLADSVPTAGFIDHVTLVLLLPVTAAVNCCALEAVRVAVAGVTLNATTACGCNVTTALAALVVSATLVAVTVTLCAEAMDAGAVYKPLPDSVPIAGFIDHVTLVLLLPVTAAVNCCALEAFRVAAAGLIFNATVVCGSNVTTALATFVGSATLVAVTVTMCVRSIAAAVYKPLAEIVPNAGLIDHVTLVLLLPLTAAVNCCVLGAARVAIGGFILTTTELPDVTAMVPVVEARVPPLPSNNASIGLPI
jgi:hypothetical protein